MVDFITEHELYTLESSASSCALSSKTLVQRKMSLKEGMDSSAR